VIARLLALAAFAGIFAIGRQLPKLVQVSAQRNKIVDTDEWFKRNGLELPVQKTQGNPPAPIQPTVAQHGIRRLIRMPDARIGLYQTHAVLYPSSGGTFELDLRPHFEPILKAWADKFQTDPEVRWAWMDASVLYVSIFHMTYAKSSRGQNGFILAFEVPSGKLLWKSAPLVCNSQNFLVHGGAILTGYGFTAEPDFLYVLHRATGKTVTKLPLSSGPEFLMLKGDQLFVRTYNMDYVFRLQ